MITRRDFLRYVVIGAAGTALPLTLTDGNGARAASKHGPRWVFLLDTHKCVGCGLCVKACKLENEIPYEAEAMRTWVERYVLTKDGGFHADTPKGARDGFVTPQIEIGPGEYQ